MANQERERSDYESRNPVDRFRRVVAALEDVCRDHPRPHDEDEPRHEDQVQVEPRRLLADWAIQLGHVPRRQTSAGVGTSFG